LPELAIAKIAEIESTQSLAMLAILAVVKRSGNNVEARLFPGLESIKENTWLV
jgi:hypothetical protein